MRRAAVCDQAIANYRKRGRSWPVSRGPVPRELPVDRSLARDRPSPYGKTGRSSHLANRDNLGNPAPNRDNLVNPSRIITIYKIYQD